MVEIRQDRVAVEVLNTESTRLLAGAFRGEQDQQPKSVPVRLYRGWGGVALLRQPSVKERLEMLSE
jgi:hypothetical protein